MLSTAVEPVFDAGVFEAGHDHVVDASFAVLVGEHRDGLAVELALLGEQVDEVLRRALLASCRA